MLALIAAYPLCAHLSAQGGPPLAAWLLASIAAAQALALARAHRPVPALIAAAIAAALIALAVSGRAGDWLWLPPVALPAILAAMFAASLLPGRVPLITRFADMLDGPLEPARLAYTRVVTRVWTVVFLALALQAAVLALFAPPWLWSLFTNGINYLVVAGVFAAEYAVRRRRFPEAGRRGFLGFMSRVVRADWRSIASGGAARR